MPDTICAIYCNDKRNVHRIFTGSEGVIAALLFATLLQVCVCKTMSFKLYPIGTDLFTIGQSFCTNA